jgi:hypothetical protein
MSALIQQALQLLQAGALARIQFQCARIVRRSLLRDDGKDFKLQCRIEKFERQAAALIQTFTPEQCMRVRLERALFLHMLQESAASRLEGWSDQDTLDCMPASHLFEWVAHDDERKELAELENAMGPDEKIRYACALCRSWAFR